MAPPVGRERSLCECGLHQENLAISDRHDVDSVDAADRDAVPRCCRRPVDRDVTACRHEIGDMARGRDIAKMLPILNRRHREPGAAAE